VAQIYTPAGRVLASAPAGRRSNAWRTRPPRADAFDLPLP
jgi:hypothetical protein